MYKRISIIGTGYVGLVSGTCFAEMGHHVVCIDQVEQKIRSLRQGQSPIYEPGLNELLQRNLQDGRLHFSTDYESVKISKMIFLAVGTPSLPNGDADLSFLFSALTSLKEVLTADKIIVIKSTVPVGTCARMKDFLQSQSFPAVSIVNNPEFLREGNAIDDFMRPDRIVIGHSHPQVFKEMQELYSPLTQQGHPLYEMSNISAEMTKYAANTFLATKISFINEISRICDATGADITEVRKGIISDKRIGPFFLDPGPGYGGSCFPKDVKAFIHSAEAAGEKALIATAVEEVNNLQKKRLLSKINHHFSSIQKTSLQGKIFAIWGVAFKPNTDDIRESAAIDMVQGLIEQGASVRFFDPVANHTFMQFLKEHYSPSLIEERIHMSNNLYNCLDQVDGLIILTDWPQFKSPDFPTIKNKIKGHAIFDGRNLYNPEEIREQGFYYYAFGRFIPK